MQVELEEAVRKGNEKFNVMMVEQLTAQEEIRRTAEVDAKVYAVEETILPKSCRPEQGFYTGASNKAFSESRSISCVGHWMNDVFTIDTVVVEMLHQRAFRAKMKVLSCHRDGLCLLSKDEPALTFQEASCGKCCGS